jgi:hypothetical protein
MCGGGSKGPSSKDLVAQENAAKSRAQAEADRLRAERDLGQQRDNSRIVSENATLANADAARRARNRTLLAGLQSEEGSIFGTLEDPNSNAEKKAKRSTLIASYGG